MLSEDERATLERWERRPKSAQALALRCRIVLECAKGESHNKDVAVRLGIHEDTVSKWRRRFLADRLEGLATSLALALRARSTTMPSRQ